MIGRDRHARRLPQYLKGLYHSSIARKISNQQNQSHQHSGGYGTKEQLFYCGKFAIANQWKNIYFGFSLTHSKSMASARKSMELRGELYE